MFNYSKELDSLPDDFEHAKQSFHKEVTKLTTFLRPPDEIQKLKVVVQNRSFIQKLIMLYYVEQQSNLGWETIEEADIVCPLLAFKGWIPNKPLEINKISFQWDDNEYLIKERWSGLAEKLKQHKVRIDNNMTYRLLKIIPSREEMELTFTHGWYQDYYETCEALTWEVAMTLLPMYNQEQKQIIESEKLWYEIKSSLSMRDKIDPRNFQNRSMTPGINTLTVITESDLEKTLFLMHHRAGNKNTQTNGNGKIPAEAIGTWHVVPAGTFQPLSQDDVHRNVELSISRNILREFGEELLNKEEYIRQPGRLFDPDRPFLVDDQLKKLKILFSTRAVELRFLGCALDCVTLKPELLTLAIVNGDRLFAEVGDLEDSWEGMHSIHEFTIKELNHWLKQPSILPAAAGCIALAIRNYKYICEIITSVNVTGGL